MARSAVRKPLRAAMLDRELPRHRKALARAAAVGGKALLAHRADECCDDARSRRARKLPANDTRGGGRTVVTLVIGVCEEGGQDMGMDMDGQTGHVPRSPPSYHPPRPAVMVMCTPPTTRISSKTAQYNGRGIWKRWEMSWTW